MPGIQPNTSIYTSQTGTPLYNYGNNQPALPQQQASVVTTAPSSSIYQYPQTSVYNDPTKKAASGVNIYIYNPSAFGAPSSTSTANANYTLPSPTTASAPNQAPQVTVVPQQSSAVANTPISNNEEVNTVLPYKTKRIVELTDNYIKTLESYLRSPDESIRKTGVKQLVNRFEEDNTRYEDPALTALLNIALQDPSVHNRMIAMSPICSGSAHGDSNTIELLKQLENSDKMYGQEAVMANNALLKTSESTKLVPDYSPDKKRKSKK